MFNNIFVTKKEETKFVPKKYVLFNINTFNAWCNDKNNGAANSGTFIRTDQLSIKIIEDYLLKCHGIRASDFNLSDDIERFRKEIVAEWRSKNIIFFLI